MNIQRYYVFLVSLLFAAGILTMAAWQRSAAMRQEATRIEADPAAGVIRFFVEGKPRAVLHSDGLHVKGDISYTGVIVDIDTRPQHRAGESADAP